MSLTRIDITIDGITPQEFTNWIVNNPNVLPFAVEYNGHYLLLLRKHTEPKENIPYYTVNIMLMEGALALCRYKGLSEEETERQLIIYQAMEPNEYKGKYYARSDWDTVSLGRLLILSVGTGTQVISIEIEWPEIFVYIVDSIMINFRNRAHNNWEEQQNKRASLEDSKAEENKTKLENPKSNHNVNPDKRESEPNLRTKIRFEVFNKIKKRHPEWGQATVAMEASKELDETVNQETVRNTYRLMGEKWIRGDRIR